MQIRHYARIIWRSLGLILLVSFLVAGATFAYNKLFITPVYQASTLIQVNPAGDSGTVFGDQAEAVTYALLVTNNVVLQAAARQLPNVTAGQLRAAINAAPLDNTSIIQITAQTNNAQLAANMANIVAQDFINIQVTKVSTVLQSKLKQTGQLLTTAKNNIADAQNQLTALQNSHASPDTIAHQVSILNDAQSNYDNLLLTYQQLEQQLLQVNNILIQLQRATPADTPITPRTTVNTISAAVLGALLAIVFVFVRDWVDDSIKTSEDVAHLTLLEPLGSVPLSQKPTSLTSLRETKNNDQAVEQAFAIMGMSLSLEQKNRSAILVTSLRSQAGTTTAAINLAISLARLKKRVLLIDAHLDQPSLHNLFQFPNDKGLVNSLPELLKIGEDGVPVWLKQWSTEIPNLWLLPVGPLTPHPEAVLRSPEMRVLVRSLLGPKQDTQNTVNLREGIIDYIIFDTSSLKASADPVALTSVADYTVLVVQAGKERGEALNKAAAIFQRLGSPVLGVIVNRQSAKHQSYIYANKVQNAN
jgi:capsular exopolysaccharide synthesis family protein